MKPNGYGKVINIGSICGHVIRPELRHSCCVSKAAGIHMTRAAAPELIKSGTRGKRITPGATKANDLFPEVISDFAEGRKSS